MLIFGKNIIVICAMKSKQINIVTKQKLGSRALNLVLLEILELPKEFAKISKASVESHLAIA